MGQLVSGVRKDDPEINDPEISELFDLLISDPQDSEEKHHHC